MYASWRGWRGSDPQPSGSKPDALSSCAIAPTTGIIPKCPALVAVSGTSQHAPSPARSLSQLRPKVGEQHTIEREILRSLIGVLGIALLGRHKLLAETGGRLFCWVMIGSS